MPLLPFPDAGAGSVAPILASVLTAHHFPFTPLVALLQTLPTAPAPLASAAPAVDLVALFQKAGLSLLTGALVGLERERSVEDRHKLFAGIRTFPLVGLLGFLAALLAEVTTPWMLIAMALGFFGLVVASYVFAARDGYYGATSEIAALVVFVLGALVYYELFAIAIAASVTLALMLSMKSPLQRFVGRVTEEDIYATLKFAIITAIILPVLPDRVMGPLDVLNPRHIWYMVVLIAGISFAGYVLVKIFGSTRGIALTGLLGGFVSSTAVTLSFSQKSCEAPELGRTFASAIVLACTIMYPRILIEIAVVNSSLLAFFWPYLLALTLTGVGASLLLLLGSRPAAATSTPVTLENPFELRSAIKFGVIFAVILFVSKAAQLYMGEGGMYLAAALAGITDVDAITLSMANLAHGTLGNASAATAIAIAITVNTIVKAGIALSLGAPSLRRYTLPGFGAVLLAALGVIAWLLFGL